MKIRRIENQAPGQAPGMRTTKTIKLPVLGPYQVALEAASGFDPNQKVG